MWVQLHVGADPPKTQSRLACNFTEEELKLQFATSETGLVYQCVSYSMNRSYCHSLLILNQYFLCFQFTHSAPYIHFWWTKRKCCLQYGLPEANDCMIRPDLQPEV